MHIEVVATLKLGISLLVTTLMHPIKTWLSTELSTEWCLVTRHFDIGKALHHLPSLKFLCLSTRDTLYLFTDAIGHTQKNKFYDKKCILPGARDIAQLTFYVSLTSKHNAGLLLQV